jgi:hypothetical protein
VASNCWYSLHAPDAASSAMGVAGCIGLLPQMECGALLGNRWPEACRIAPGTRAAGQVCSVDAQCDTTRCMRASETACGSCAPLATAEQPCRASSDCSAGLACSQDGKCRAPGAPGNACDLQHACAYGVSCASGSCVPALGQGAQCKLDSDSCDRYAGLACGATSARCEPWPVFAMTPAGSTFDFQAPEGCP